MRRFSRLGLAALAAVLAVAPLVAARADGYPSKPIRWIVPFPAGGPADILSRLMADQIPKDGGPTVLVENKPGAGTLIGTEAAAKAEPDGHTVVLIAPSRVYSNG